MKSEFQIKFDLIEIFRQKKHERVADGEGGEGGGHERQEGCQHCAKRAKNPPKKIEIFFEISRKFLKN